LEKKIYLSPSHNFGDIKNCMWISIYIYKHTKDIKKIKKYFNQFVKILKNLRYDNGSFNEYLDAFRVIFEKFNESWYIDRIEKLKKKGEYKWGPQ
jgi:hypothetical protein